MRQQPGAELCSSRSSSSHAPAAAGEQLTKEGERVHVTGGARG